MSCNSQKLEETTTASAEPGVKPASHEEAKSEPLTTDAKQEPLTEAATEPAVAKGSDDEGDDLMPEEEVTTGDWKLPQVNVKVVQTSTGEEQEELVWSHRAKLYRWQDREWKERGIGDAKLLKDKETEKIRFLLRQEKTCKIMANHYVLPIDKMCELTECAGSDKIWAWSVLDCAEEQATVEQFALRFGQAEVAAIFKTEFEKVAALNKKLYDEGKFSK